MSVTCNDVDSVDKQWLSKLDNNISFANMVHFEYSDSLHSNLNTIYEDILEAPEEFRNMFSHEYGNIGHSELEEGVEAHKHYVEEQNRDEPNIQDVTCGCTSQEAISEDYNKFCENSDSRDIIVNSPTVETINLITDCNYGNNHSSVMGETSSASPASASEESAPKQMTGTGTGTSSVINKVKFSDRGHIDEIANCALSPPASKPCVGVSRVSAVSGSEADSAVKAPTSNENTQDNDRAACVRETKTPSIVDGVMICATAPGCSRVSDAPANVSGCANHLDIHLEDSESGPNKNALREQECRSCRTVPSILHSINSLQAHTDYTPSDLSLELIHTKNELNKLKEHVNSWKPYSLLEQDDDLLSSKDINRRTVDSRLKHLEGKLKAAGISDSDTSQDKKQVVEGDYDANQNCLSSRTHDLNEINSEFDASQYGSYACLGDGDYFVVYDELDEVEDADENESRRTMKSMTGTDGERKQHNPDKENLKSLLKRPGRNKEKKKSVIFKEDRNEFFDADYIILIREDCDYDEEEDDGICTCNQHEMVRLTCCEPNCNCNIYEYDPTPQSPKFAPPLEFVDAVTLSPPDGYKDMELGEQQILALQQMARRGQMAPVCRECSQTHDDEGEYSEEEQGSDQETEKTDQSQQTTPTTPPADTEIPQAHKKYLNEAITIKTETKHAEEMDEQHKESSDSPISSLQPGGSPISGILKGGRLWKQQSVDISTVRAPPPSEPQPPPRELPQVTEVTITSDDEGSGKRSVRFIESGSANANDQVDGVEQKLDNEEKKYNSVSPEPTEMTLTFKLGKHILISNNSLKPNSAVRQLFPCTKPEQGEQKGEQNAVHQYLVTSESLRAFEEGKKLKLPHIEADESIKRVIERNTLRRSLIRYEPRAKKNVQKTDNSLVERIKQLTCDVDEPPEEEQARSSPAGEEARNSPEITALKSSDKSFSPSSSSSSNSSVSSTYKRISDLFAKKDKPDIQETDGTTKQQAPDLGGPQEFNETHNPLTLTKLNPGNITGSENRKQFLATLGPLTACVGGSVHAEDYYYQTSGDRMSMASSVGTEYSLEDIEEGLKKDEESKRTPPDVLAGTPSASESGDELAMFVQQDASRIERIKKKYQQDEEEDEHDDYGFNRRPSVRGIKPRFGSTTEILQQIQQQMQPPPGTNNTPPRNTQVAWPYYSETNLSGVDNKRNINHQGQNYQYAQYRPTTLIDENSYQNCANQQQQQRCPQVTYRSNMNVYTSSPVMRIGGGCGDYYQSSLPRNRNGRPQSPPPQEVTKGFHQMMYIPYNHIEGFQGTGYYDATYARVNNQNQINKRYIDPNYQEVYAGKPRPSYTITTRSESPAYSTARSTQTSQTCTYYPSPRYRPPNGIGWIDGVYKPAGRYPRQYNAVDNISLTDSDSQHSSQIPNGYKDSMPNSPTKPKFIERGVPEGAASVSSQDGHAITSPTSPQNPQGANTNNAPTQKPLFYAMNV